MQNHSEKRRDMCRSILPSSARRSARENLAAWKRHHRRSVRLQIHDAMGYEWLDYEGTTLDVDTNRPIDGGFGWDRIITHIVRQRRDSDKVGPIMAWARATAAALPGDDLDKYMWFKRVLPDNLIGRHALSHIEFIFDDLPGSYNRFRYRGTTETRAQRQARWAQEHETWTALVRTVIETRHKEFNEGNLDRCLGLHDVDRWCRMNPARDHMTQVLKIAARDSATA